MVPFVGPSYHLATRKADVQRAVNLYPVQNEVVGGKTGSYLQAVAGLDLFSAPYVPPPPCICTDGPEWTATTIAAATWHSSAFAFGKFFAFGVDSVSGDSLFAKSNDLGSTWAAPLDYGAFGGTVGQAAVGAGLLLVALTAVNYATTPDGVNWTTRTWPSAFPSGVMFGNGLFVVMPNSGTSIRTSPDGITWTARTAPTAADYRACDYGNGRWVAVRGTGTIYSSDAVTWTDSTTTWTSSGWQTIAFGAGVFVIIDKNNSGAPCAKWSADGDVWASANLPFDGSSTYDGLMFSKGRFIATKNNSSAVAISVDGKVWSASSFPTPSAVSRWGALATDGAGSYIGLNTSNSGITNAMRGICCFGDEG